MFFTGKCLCEKRIHEMDNVGNTAVIATKHSSSLFGELIPQLLEKCGLGAPKSINGLLAITNQKEPSFEPLWTSQGPDDLRLDRIGVLKFVDQEDLNLVDQASRDLGMIPKHASCSAL